MSLITALANIPAMASSISPFLKNNKKKTTTSTPNSAITSAYSQANPITTSYGPAKPTTTTPTVPNKVGAFDTKTPTTGGGSSWGPETATTAPSNNFNYSQTTPTVSPTTANTADLSAGFTSSDPEVQKKLVAMNAATALSGGGESSPRPVNEPLPSPYIGAPKKPIAPTSETMKTVAQRELDALRQQYLSLFAPSSAEQQYQQQLADYREQANLGISGVEGQGRGIPLELVRGTQAKLQEQAAIQEQAIMDRLKMEQENRKMAQQGAEAQLGFLQDDMAAQQAAELARMQGMEPQEIDGRLVALNPATGQYEVVYEPPVENIILSQGQTVIDPNTGQIIASMPKDQPPITVNPGQTVLDPRTGEVLFQAPDKATPLPTSIQEYLWATQNGGYTGDYNSFTNQKSGSTGTADLNATQAKNLGFYNRAASAEANIQAALPNVSNLLQSGLPAVLQGENYKLYKQAAETWIKAILRQESGAAIPQEELDSYFKTYFPVLGDSEKVIAQKQSSRQDALDSLLVGQDQDPLGLGFSNDLSTSVNGSKNVLDLGVITGYGSPYWKHGLDIDLKIGDPVPSPVTGTVIYVGSNGGFGNQVKIRDAQGREHWLSHLQASNVKVGQQVGKGTVIGTGGNTGSVIPSGGGDGSHLDYTVKDANGQYITPKQIESMIKSVFV